MPQRIDATLEVIAHVVLSGPQLAKRDYETKRETALTRTIPTSQLCGHLWKSPLKMSCRPSKGS